jgi:hypothetical protein
LKNRKVLATQRFSSYIQTNKYRSYDEGDRHKRLSRIHNLILDTAGAFVIRSSPALLLCVGLAQSSLTIDTAYETEEIFDGLREQ